MLRTALIVSLLSGAFAGPAAAEVRVFDAWGTPVPGPAPSWYVEPDGGMYPDAAWNEDRTARAVIRRVEIDPCSYPERRLVLRRPGGYARTLVAGGDDPTFFAWSPDGSQLAVLVEPDPRAVVGPRRPWPARIPRDYAMFSRAGNHAMRAIVVRAAKALRAGAGRQAVLRRVRHDFSHVADRFDEAWDTAVREELGDALDAWLVAAGFEVIDSYDEITC